MTAMYATCTCYHGSTRCVREIFWYRVYKIKNKRYRVDKLIQDKGITLLIFLFKLFPIFLLLKRLKHQNKEPLMRKWKSFANEKVTSSEKRAPVLASLSPVLKAIWSHQFGIECIQTGNEYIHLKKNMSNMPCKAGPHSRGALRDLQCVSFMKEKNVNFVDCEPENIGNISWLNIRVFGIFTWSV